MALNVVDAPGTTTAQTYYLCADYVTNAVSLIYGELTLQEIRAGSDIAESYNAATDTPLTEGNIVSLDPTITDGVQPSQSAYDSTLVGVVSTQPGAVLGNASPQGSQILVALAGRVPVQVTNANGNISIGDELTSSDIPGVAMRATEPGRVVGVAMENFASDPSAGTTTGSILVFVNPGWSPGISTSAANTTTSVSSFSTSVDDALQHFFGIVADASNAVQAFVRASMVAVENLFVKTETILPGGSIVVPSGRDQISGSATLAPLYQNVFIANQQVTSSSKIFVTPTTLITVPLVVISKQDGVGFTVGVSDPQANGISFDWVIVQSYSAGGDGTSEIQGGAPANSGGGGVTNDTSSDNTSAASSSDVASDDATSNASSSAGTSTDMTASSTDDTSAPTSSDQSNNVSSSDETTTPALSDPTTASASATDSTVAPASVGDGSSADAAATPVSAPTDSSPPAPTPDPSADPTAAQ